MPDVFVAVEGENEGEVNYVSLTDYDNVSEVINSLPEDIVQSHSEFQRINTLYEGAVDESKKRLKRAQTAEEQLKAKSSQKQSAQTTTEEENTEPPEVTQQTIDVEELKTSLKQEILGDIQNERKAKSDRDLMLNNLVKKHRLHRVPDAMVILENSTNPEQVAELLGRSAKQFDEVDGGVVDVESDDFGKRIMGNLGLPTD